MYAPDWPLETARLTLRPFERGDLDAVHAIRSQPAVVRYLYEEPLDRDGARRVLERKLRGRGIEREGDWLSAAVRLRGADRIVGDIAFHWVSEAHRTGEIGFVFDPAHQGNGYATEAARAVLDWAFPTLGLHRVIGRTEARNAASARVLEKLGMRLEAHLLENEWVKGEWQSELDYAILESEWRR